MYALKKSREIIPIDTDEINIGRHTANQITINHLRVSRYHSVISLINEKIFLKDKSTINGTYIFENRILPEREILLKTGDLIGFGSKAEEGTSHTFEIVERPKIIEIDLDEESDSFEKQCDDNEVLSKNCSEFRVNVDEPISIENEEKLFDSPTERINENNKSGNWSNNEMLHNDRNDQNSSEGKNNTNSDENCSTNSQAKKTQNLFFNNNFDNDYQKSMQIKSESSVDDVRDSDEVKYVNYSMVDEIITLDSDEDDFPSSQFNESKIAQIPDYSSTFEILYQSESIDNHKDDDVLYCNEDSWLELLSQSNCIDGNKSEYLKEGNKEFDTIDPNKLVNDNNLEEITEHVNDNANDFIKNVNNDISSQYIQCSNKSNVEKESEFVIKPFIIRLNDCLDFRNNLGELQLKDEIINKNLKRKLNDENIVQGKPEKNSEITELEEKLNKSVFSSLKKPKRFKIKKIKNKTTSLRNNIVNNKKITLEKHKNDNITNSSRQQSRKRIKEKLKQLVKSPVFENKSVLKTSSTEFKPKVKITDKNRGVFLTELPSVDKHQSKKKKKLHSDGVVRVKTSCHNESVYNNKELPPVNNILEVNTRNNVSLSKAHVCENTDTSKLVIYLENQEKDKNLRNSNSNTSSLDNDSSIKIHPENQENKNYVEGYSNSITFNKLGTVKNEEIGNSLKSSINTTVKLVDREPVKSVPNIKSNLKCNKFSYESKAKVQISKKKVSFNFLTDYKLLESGGERERKNNNASLYKLNEHLIRDCFLEFDRAIAKVCSWNVRWLEEQQKFSHPPPLYPEKQACVNLSVIGQYKERIKDLLFHNVWQCIYNSWNKPNNDCLPHTQLITEKSNMSYLQIIRIDKPDSFSPAQLWIIHAERCVIDEEDDLTSGVIVILNFYVQKSTNENPKKTMVFAYVAYVNTFNSLDGSTKQRIIFKIFGKPFTIETGLAKMKILSYTKSLIRQFQALAMIMRSPLTGTLTDPNIKFDVQSAFKQHCVKDKFLDYYQRSAILKCLDCIHSKNASVCLIDGYPGTGKTQVIVSLMKDIFFGGIRQQFPDDMKILIVTSCDNTADDLIYSLEKLNNREEKRSMNLLRFGNCANMHSSTKNCTLNAKIEDIVKNDINNELINFEEEKHNILAKINSSQLVLQNSTTKEEKRAEVEAKLRIYLKEYSDMQIENSEVIKQLKSNVAKELVVENSDIIVTSVSSCWSSYFENTFIPTHFNKGDIHKFSVCIFDDANLFSEIVLLIPIMLMVPHLILIGDHNNDVLVKTQQSPFNRLLKDFKAKLPESVVTLKMQYRIVPEILSPWLTERFGITCETKPGIHKKLNLKSFVVIDHYIKNYYNEEEVYDQQIHLCTNLFRTILHIGPSDIRIGIIVSDHYLKENIKSTIRNLWQERKAVIDTLHGFNGREQDVIILFLPLSLAKFEKCFYTALTRAKCCLIICGNFSTNEEEVPEIFASLVKSAERRNALVTWEFNQYETMVDFLFNNVNPR